MRFPVLLFAAVLVLGAGSAHADGRLRGRVPRPPVVLVAQAVPTASCKVTEIKATKEKKGIDAKLKWLAAPLGKGPFKLYDTYTLLSEATPAAPKDKPVEAVLSDKSKVTLIYKGPSEVKGGKTRIRIEVDIDDAGGTRVQQAVQTFDSGETVFVRVDEFPGKTAEQDWAHIDALTCTVP